MVARREGVGRFTGPAGYVMMRSHRPESGRVSQFTDIDSRTVANADPGAEPSGRQESGPRTVVVLVRGRSLGGGGCWVRTNVG
jgi:hypothetical protein